MITYVIILIAVIVLAIPSIILVNKYPKTRILFQVVFTILIVVFGYLLFFNINKPIKFDREEATRTEATVQKLKDIRIIQMAFKDKYSKYTGSFDTLISFVKTDSFEIERIKQVGEWHQDEMTKQEAFKAGVLVKSFTYIPVTDSIWKEKSYDIADIKKVPYTNNIEFKMAAGEFVTGSKVKVQVFECYALYVDLLYDMDPQLLSNYIDQKTKYGAFPGIKVGSLTEATNNAGNWEQ